MIPYKDISTFLSNIWGQDQFHIACQFITLVLDLLPLHRDGGVCRTVVIGDRLRVLRDEKNLTQGDIEKRTGLLRCYISRVENGHTVPSIETLEKLARALEIPLFRLFFDGQSPPELLASVKPIIPGNEDLWGGSRKQARYLAKFRRLLSTLDEKDRVLLLSMARRMAALSR
jgi:transcriptional regulator with XRE-family HTH domain